MEDTQVEVLIVTAAEVMAVVIAIAQEVIVQEGVQTAGLTALQVLLILTITSHITIIIIMMGHEAQREFHHLRGLSYYV